jgi:hypothetical protein
MWRDEEIEKQNLKISPPEMRQVVFCLQKPA